MNWLHKYLPSTGVIRNKIDHFFDVFGLLYFPRVWLRSGIFINSKILYISTRITHSKLLYGNDKEIKNCLRIEKRYILILVKTEHYFFQ